MSTEGMIDLVYDAMEGCEDVLNYHDRHGVPSLLILTQHCPDVAIESARKMRPRIEGKRVVEIGAGVGFLAIEMAKIAASVVAIEADPAWSWVFTRSLYIHKPPNLTWVFGAAQQMIGAVRGDIAVIFTHSGIEDMRNLGSQFCPEVFMPLQEPDQFIVDADGLAILHSYKRAALRAHGLNPNAQ